MDRYAAMVSDRCMWRVNTDRATDLEGMMSEVKYRQIADGQYIVELGVTAVCGVRRDPATRRWAFYTPESKEWSSAIHRTRVEAHHAAVAARRKGGWQGPSATPND